MLLVKNNVLHDQFVLPNVVNLETVAVCLYLQNNILLLFVSCYNPPESPVPYFDLNSLFSSFDSVALIGDLNCKHIAWYFISVDRNGQTHISYCLKTLQLTTLITPRTFIPTSDLGSLMLLSQSTMYYSNHCLSLYSPLTITWWYLRFYYVPLFLHLFRFWILHKLTGHFSFPH
jgi:hypothetical protein